MNDFYAMCLLVALFLWVFFVQITNGTIGVRWAWTGVWWTLGVQFMRTGSHPPDASFPNGINGHSVLEIGCLLFTLWFEWTHRPKQAP